MYGVLVVGENRNLQYLSGPVTSKADAELWKHSHNWPLPQKIYWDSCDWSFLSPLNLQSTEPKHTQWTFFIFKKDLLFFECWLIMGDSFYQNYAVNGHLKWRSQLRWLSDITCAHFTTGMWVRHQWGCCWTPTDVCNLHFVCVCRPHRCKGCQWTILTTKLHHTLVFI